MEHKARPRERCYRGHIIEALPQQLANGKWSPSAMVRLNDGNDMHVAEFYSRNLREFDSEDEAREASLQLGKAAVDRGT